MTNSHSLTALKREKGDYKDMKKKLLFTLVVAALCLSACGNKDAKETTPSLEVIHPTETESQPETVVDKLEEPKTLTVETAPAPMSIEIDENGNVVEESSQPSENTGMCAACRRKDAPRGWPRAERRKRGADATDGTDAGG